jgi:hypothetical protein
MRSLFHMRPIDVWKIYDPLGVWIGNIDTVKLDSSTGMARLVCASFFDIPERQIVLPWRTLVLDRARGVFFTTLTMLRMRSSPSFGDDTPVEDVEEQLLRHYRGCLTPAEQLVDGLPAS